MDIAVYESVPHEFRLQDIFFDNQLIDPDYIISPDDIILQSDSQQTAQNKVQSMINLFYTTLEAFGSSKQQIILVIQGFDRDSVAINFTNTIVMHNNAVLKTLYYKLGTKTFAAT